MAKYKRSWLTATTSTDILVTVVPVRELSYGCESLRPGFNAVCIVSDLIADINIESDVMVRKNPRA